MSKVFLYPKDTNSGGDVVGPVSSSDKAVAIFDGTTGKLLKNNTFCFLDTTNSRLGVGLSNPSTTIEAYSTGTSARIRSQNNSTTGEASLSMYCPQGGISTNYANWVLGSSNTAGTYASTGISNANLCSFQVGAAVTNIIIDWYSTGSFIFARNGAAICTLTYNGKMFVGGTTTPTATIHLPAHSTSANTAPIKLSNVNAVIATPEDGAFEYANGNLYFTIGTTRNQLNPGIPQISKSVGYTTVATDANSHIYHPSADTTVRTWTIDSNANVPYPIGTTLTFINDTSGGTISIAITSDTLVLAGAGTTGTRTLAANGIATAIKVTATRWIISGTNLT